MKLVEQELWQREEKGLIGVLPVRDGETASVAPAFSPGDLSVFIAAAFGCFYFLSAYLSWTSCCCHFLFW